MQEHKSLGKTSPWIEIDSTDYNWYSEEAVKQITSISTLREIYLTGGEPFMVKNLDKFINKLDRNIKLRFNTNGTLYNKKLLDILKEFNYVNMCYSIDGVGSVNDYIRYGSKFSEIINNLEIAIDCGFDVSVSPTVQILNVLRMDEYNDYFARYNIKIYENILSHPSYLSLNNSNEKHRQDIKNYSMGEYVNETTMFINSVKTLDKNRAINILDYLPELGQYYDFS
jgi:glutamate-1-semialdehyde 2,1-aminomutase